METIVVDDKHNISSKTPLYQRYGVCNACHAACKTCKGPLVEDCFQCSDGYEVRQNYCRKKLIMNFLDPDMLSFFVWVIILCTSAILLFGVVFIVLQARDHRILCWKEKRHCDDDMKGKYNGVNTTLSQRGERETNVDREDCSNVLRNVHYRADDNYIVNFNVNRNYPLHSTRTWNTESHTHCQKCLKGTSRLTSVFQHIDIIVYIGPKINVVLLPLKSIFKFPGYNRSRPWFYMPDYGHQVN